MKALVLMLLTLAGCGVLPQKGSIQFGGGLGAIRTTASIKYTQGKEDSLKVRTPTRRFVVPIPQSTSTNHFEIIHMTNEDVFLKSSDGTLVLVFSIQAKTWKPARP